MKKIVVVFLLSILIICCIVCIYLFISNRNMATDLSNIKKEIKSVEKNINDSKGSYEVLTKSYQQLLDESQEKVYEYQIWEETKEKLQQALSQ